MHCVHSELRLSVGSDSNIEIDLFGGTQSDYINIVVDSVLVHIGIGHLEHLDDLSHGEPDRDK